ncbi:uncharacterized protein AMSG_07578 [Thecamonas trahens ATCC 50062]|uniref:Fibronectin type III domain-containing protein n=1 Tax=Thecamonas trahens ATCC 50062 TaxID=461836 RepID=A0A0L0DGS4_THETB|nr:hypothetical protein AMSG_07578 [Thecamonas trahens ATCC 50062]KNC51395.1 hypothetical protein AMSG_07578 [Thecamonas trahens ATCC 50062]|eukprot:XP_013756063.1 hypothetical protein AMSG_07578 [Thecamonas trahens ATCC 50062]
MAWQAYSGGRNTFGGTSTFVALADFTAAGYPQVLARDGTQLILFSHTGSWSSTIIATESSAIFAAVADDFDGDGDVDIAFTSGIYLYLRLNNGAGVFGSPINLLSFVFAKDLQAIDWNGDGYKDIIITQDGRTHEFALALNDGAGASFSLAGNAVPTFDSQECQLVDVDRDSDLDIVVFRASELIIVINDNGGPLTDSHIVLAPLDPSSTDTPSTAIVDLDGDGSPEFYALFQEKLFTLDFSGTEFVLAVKTAAVGIKLNTGDVDSDGDSDLMLVYNDELYWMENAGGGELRRQRMVSNAGVTIDTFGAGDVRNTANVHVPDLARAASSSWTSLSVNPDLPFDTGLDINSGDIDGDGLIDIVVGGKLPSSTYRMVWSRTTSFPVTPLLSVVIADEATPTHVLDVDGDGDVDIVSLYKKTMSFHINADGVGTAWQAHTLPRHGSIALDMFSSHFKTIDFNNDGHMDLIDTDGTNLQFWMNRGDFTFDPNPVTHFDGYVVDVGQWIRLHDTIDVDGDGGVDLLVAEGSTYPLSILRSVSNMTSEAPVAVTPKHSGALHRVIVARVNDDAYDDIVIGDSNRISFMLNNGSGGFHPRVEIGLLDAVFVDVVRLEDRVAVVGADTNSRIYISYSLDLSTPAFEPLLQVDSLSGVYALVAGDFDGDDSIDIVSNYILSSTLRVYTRATRTALYSYEPRSVVYDPHMDGCHYGPTSASCILANMARLRVCSHDVLLLPPGRYGCRRDAHFQIARPISFAAQIPGTVTFDCESGANGAVLFRAVFNSITRGVGTTLALESINIRGMTTTASNIHGAPGLRIEGADVTIKLTHVTVSNSISEPLSTGNAVLDVGRGGAMLVSDGASAVLHNATFSHNTAFSFGGAVYVRTAGSSVIATDSTFESSTAAEGGVLVVAQSAAASLTRCTLAHNMASGAGGGAISVNSLATLSMIESVVSRNMARGSNGGGVQVKGTGTVTLTACRIEDNTAVFGGGLAAVASDLQFAASAATTSAQLPVATGALAAAADRASGIAASVALRNTNMTGNVATAKGGGLFACGSPIEVSGTTSVLAGNVDAISAIASDALLCAADGFAPATGSAAQLPWLRMTDEDYSAVIAGRAAVGGPLVRFEWVTPPASRLDSGRAFDGVFRGLDTFDQAHVEIAQELLMSSGSEVVVVSGAPQSTLDAVLALPPDVRLLAKMEFVDELPTEVGWTLSATGAEAIRLEGTLTVTLCAAGSGKRGFASGVEVLECACPANTVVSTGSANITAGTCVCVANTWSPSGLTNMPCEACPTGALCDGVLAKPRAAPGFYPDGGAFVTCPTEGACLGNGRCAPGYTSRLCAKCTDGYYRLGGSCRKCDSGKNVVVAVLVVVVALAITGALYAFSLAESVRYKFVAAMIGVNALQISALYGRLDLEWGPIADVYFDFASSLNLNFELTSPECSVIKGTDVWVLKWVLALMLPAFAAMALLVIAVALYFASKAGLVFAGKTFGEFVSGYGRTMFQILVLLYLPLAGAAFSIFGCREDEAGKWILDADPSRTCYDSAWWSLFLPGIIAVAVYGIGLPGAVVWVLARKRSRMDPVTFMLRFSFLVSRFRGDHWWFETAIMVRKLFVVICMTFLYTPEGKANTAVFVLVSAIVQLAMSRPYLSEFHNSLALVVLAATTTVLFAGTFDDATMRRVGVIGGIVINVIGIVGGNAIDAWLIAKREAKDEEEFCSSGELANSRDFEAESTSHMSTGVELDEYATEPPMASLRMDDTLFATDVSTNLASVHAPPPPATMTATATATAIPNRLDTEYGTVGCDSSPYNSHIASTDVFDSQV